MTSDPQNATPEFSRPVRTDELSSREVVREIEATEPERQALAARFGLLDIGRLHAVLRMRRSGDGVVRVQGTLDVDVVQTCVVTLEPAPGRVYDEFTAVFAPENRIAELNAEFDTDPLAEDVSEPLTRGGFDAGELVAQHLSLALDPFPRRQGAAFEPPEAGQDADESRKPLAALARLRRDQ